MRKLLERHSFSILLVIILAGAFSFAYYALAYNPGTNITLCTSGVSQPACYGTAYPSPTVSWTIAGASSQSSYRVWIDQNQLFNNPAIDTGEVISGSNSYQVNQAGLRSGQRYYWRVRVKDNFSSWTNWAEHESTFDANPICDTSPTVNPGTMSVSNGDSATYCSGAAHYFAWTYSDVDLDEESRFEFQVDNNSNFSSPEVDRDYVGLSNPSPTVNNQTVIVTESPGADQMGYNTTYYWRVKVYDEDSNDSGWVNGPTFTTEAHRYPTIGLSWSPQYPNQGEDVQFTDGSTVYGGATKSIWSWTFENGTPASSSSQNPVVQFSTTGNKNIVLGVTDSSGFTCDNSSDPEIISVQFNPDWKEVNP
ncbi:MAG: PKD domain-containing protein [Candidatus Portnoybacteria bacterium]